MDSSWPGYDLICVDCGAACRPIDKFCSQCGRRDPAGAQDAELNAPTLVASEATADKPYPTFVAPSHQGTLAATGRRKKGGRDTLAVQQMLQPGSVFGRRYRIQRFLGAGAMGYVCSVIDESIDEVIALKVLSAPIQEDPEGFERFKLELKLARRIRHRNVVQSFDLGFAEGYPFISMEYIDADNVLKHLHKNNFFEEEEALTIFRQVLRGLRAAHDLGIVHRDIKPENILLNKDKLAFITDFGIATSANLVKQRELAGTPDYMAPEQLRMEAVSPASDFYSCGVMLYRMLTGNLPFRATSMMQIIDAHLNLPPDPIPSSADVSNETREIIDWMLQKKAADRPQGATPLLERIDALLKATPMSRSAARRSTVLVVEHDAETMALIRSAVEGEGLRVVAADNARDGVNLAFEQAPSMIFLDARIRGGFEVGALPTIEVEIADGLGFVRIVRSDEKLRAVPIVLITDKTLSHLDSTFAAAGIADVMIKPLQREDLAAAVRRIKPAEDVDATLR